MNILRMNQRINKVYLRVLLFRVILTTIACGIFSLVLVIRVDNSVYEVFLGIMTLLCVYLIWYGLVDVKLLFHSPRPSQESVNESSLVKELRIFQETLINEKDLTDKRGGDLVNLKREVDQLIDNLENFSKKIDLSEEVNK